MEKKFYEEPNMELIYVAVEKGFEASQNELWGYPGEDPEFNDYGEF